MNVYFITGGAGFIGSNFVHFILKKEKESKVIIYDSLEYSGIKENLYPYLKEDHIFEIEFGRDVYPYKRKKRRDFYVIKEGNELDRVIKRFIDSDKRVILLCASVTNKLALSSSIKYSNRVFHFAAETHVDRSIIYPDRFVFTDFVGSYYLLEGFRIHHRTKGVVVYISTDEVYGEILRGKAGENYPFFPSSPYAAAKAGADRLFYSYYRTYGLPILIVRPSNVFGERQFPEKFISFSIMRILNNKEILIYGDGRQKRNWIYQEDVVRGIYIVYKKGKIGEVYNIPGDVDIENIKVAKLILKISGKDMNMIKFIKDRPGHDRRYAMKGNKIKSIGFSIRWDFLKSLKRTFEFYRKNFEFYNSLLKRKETKEFMKKWYNL